MHGSINIKFGLFWGLAMVRFRLFVLWGGSTGNVANFPLAFMASRRIPRLAFSTSHILLSPLSTFPIYAISVFPIT